MSKPHSRHFLKALVSRPLDCSLAGNIVFIEHSLWIYLNNFLCKGCSRRWENSYYLNTWFLCVLGHPTIQACNHIFWYISCHLCIFQSYCHTWKLQSYNTSLQLVPEPSVSTEYSVPPFELEKLSIGLGNNIYKVQYVHKSYCQHLIKKHLECCFGSKSSPNTPSCLNCKFYKTQKQLSKCMIT